MKEITLKFREVAVDGLPEKSMDVFVNYEYGTASTTYSEKHKCFCCSDSTSKEDANYRRKSWDDVPYWIPLDEFNAAFKEDAQDVQALD
jgi:hypothetical protein